MLRFHARQHGIPVNAELRVIELRTTSARVHVRLGLFAMNARFSVAPIANADPASTRLGVTVSVASEVPVVGGSLDRFAARQLASQAAESMLTGIAARAEGTASRPSR